MALRESDPSVPRKIPQLTAPVIEMTTYCMINLIETISGSGVGLFASTDTVHFTEPLSVNFTAFWQGIYVNLRHPYVPARDVRRSGS